MVYAKLNQRLTIEPANRGGGNTSIVRLLGKYLECSGPLNKSGEIAVSSEQ